MKKLLALNRGEIAIRIMRAATELGLRTVAIYSAGRPLSLHRFKADEAYQIGEGKGPVAAYLDIDGIVALRKRRAWTRSTPATGFSPRIRRCREPAQAAGITFVGPSAELLELLGDKTAARAPRGASGRARRPGHRRTR